MKKFCVFFFVAVMVVLGACDLRPRILSLPDSVGDFISARYPALLADPVTESEIYNSAATDYGVYASPELYGTETATTDDYVLYASVNDYIVPPAAEDADVSVDAGDEVSAQTDSVTEPDIATDDGVQSPIDDATVTDDIPTAEDPPSPAVPDFLNVPMYGGAMEIVTVAKGDTLYSIAKQNGVTVDDLIAANNLTAPYTLRIGQQIRITTNPTPIVVPARPAVTDSKPQTLPMPADKAPKIEKPAQPATPAPAPAVPKATTPAAPAKPAPASEKKSAPTPAPQPAKATTTRVDVTEVVVTPGDTLYSLSRKYSVPVNDLAVMNNLAAPFALYAGQRVRVPNLATAKVAAPAPKATTPAASTATKSTKTTAGATTTKPATTAKATAKPTAPAKATNTKTASTQKAPAKPAAKTTTKTAANNKEKISSDPSQKLPSITARSSSKFSWPVRGKILSNYGAKPNGLVNDGINISAARGTAVLAAENGVVAYAGNEVRGMGNLIILQHADGFMTVYAHMDSMAVRRGAKVAVGQKIGTVGQTGKVDKPQLHFEIRKGTKAYNPSQYLKK